MAEKIAGSDRARQERFIVKNDTNSGMEFAKALSLVVGRHGGLPFYTDEQIAEIAAEMVRQERWDCAFRVQQRRQAQALMAGRAA